ncbi:GNAT family N-acetyltransferase [Shewanella pneumatophori]|uniref:GNAT family N-acetyltransferase n=1 Tax=Shewanella pneumatophori TaxID=314092 RepID=A0A9X2CGK5_9GAMM|nr:GNAT family N-acetyltransferase [Shewanella pneumatophori]MCL1137510.1 GNAT family N-acetyltransferase [Shewanella pneumatophori]
MIAIRKAQNSDVDAIFALRSRSIIAKCTGFYSEEQIKFWTQGTVTTEFTRDVIDNFYVSVVAGQVIGSGKLNITSGMLDAIFVEPEFFGKGAAKQMLAFLEALAIEHNLPSIKLDSTLNAAPFYRGCGFIGEQVSSYHSPRGISLDCVSMYKNLLV